LRRAARPFVIVDGTLIRLRWHRVEERIGRLGGIESHVARMEVAPDSRRERHRPIDLVETPDSAAASSSLRPSPIAAITPASQGRRIVPAGTARSVTATQPPRIRSTTDTGETPGVGAPRLGPLAFQELTPLPRAEPPELPLIPRSGHDPRHERDREREPQRAQRQLQRKAATRVLRVREDAAQRDEQIGGEEHPAEDPERRRRTVRSGPSTLSSSFLPSALHLLLVAPLCLRAPRLLLYRRLW